MSQSVPVQTTCPCSKKSFKDFKRHSKSKTHEKWVQDTTNELLPLLTPIDQLPAPPEWMLKDDEDSDCNCCECPDDDDEPIQLQKPKKIVKKDDSDDEPIQLKPKKQKKDEDSDDEPIFKKAKKEYDDKGIECWQCERCGRWEDWGCREDCCGIKYFF